ncbi:hypothetical protein CONLIGDRAFT_718489 [Coniochaeta ligniaria NRRL 30616]|uniref:Azaphilone pigments biosynthesis cluster protein L N-terminal domain-containing protein n=1 Tax=Coniochaeta ligniaria NRRL 30616 TaxID=1408157 RepID=A0A1J7IAV1_9PEZI|nr:hypothetical protein CONLIGDRAFT_718489 [Coniochaeta ligniaria NRRL 30616]
MDPISIAVSAISVAGAAAKISLWLYNVVETTARIDSTVLALSREVKSLDDNLKSLSRTLQGCQSQALTLMHMNDEIWRSIENNLHDCGEALEELQTLVEEVKRPVASRNIFRKPNLAMRLELRKKEITEFQDKINKSNSAMQTAVGVVSLSLALRQNASSDLLMSELQRLRELVEKTQRAARDSSNVSYPAAARMSRSLQGLAQAARKFHSNASTTASTRYEGARQSRGRYGSHWLGSDAGSLSDFERDRIRDWTSGLRVIDEVTDTASTVGTTPTGTTTTDRDTVITGITTPDPEEEEDDDLELDLEIFQNAEELGRMSFAKRDYENAEKFLNKAMSGVTGTSSDPAQFENLKLQLSICYCFQAKWQAAEAVLSTLGKKKRKADLPVFHLLHAVALAHLADEKYDSAYSACKRSLQGKKKAHGGKTNQDYIDSLCLLAAICEVRGEPIEAAAIRHSIPGDKMPAGFPMPQEFIRSHKSIIDNAFGKGFNSNDEAGPSSGGHAAAEEDDTWSLHASEGDAAERIEQDTGKEITTGNDERISSQVGGWDTGKEILSVPDGSHMTVNPVTNKRIFSDVETYDEETGKILAWAEWENCEWIPLHRYFEAHHYMIDDLIIDDQARRRNNLPTKCRKDEDKHSDLLVVDIERLHDAAYGTDSLKEVYIPDVPERPMGPGPGLGISTWQPPAISTTFADEFSSNLYISEPRGDGVTTAPPLHTQNSMDNTLLSPSSPVVYRHQASRSADFTARPLEQSNNPFRRAASQRNLNNPVAETLKHTASFESLSRSHGPPAPWTGRRYGTTRESPRLLQTPAVFLRDVPDGKTDGLILGVHLGLETAEVAVSFDTGTIETCPGTLYLNHTSKPPDSIPWFDCLSHTNPPSSPPLSTPTSPSLPSDPLSLTTHPYHLLQILQLHALQSQSPLSTPTSLPLPSPATYPAAATTFESSLIRLASGLAKWIETTRSGFYLAFTPLDEIVFAVPDALLSLPAARHKLLDVLSRNELFRHAKVTPASVAVVWYFLRTQGREVLLGGVGGGRGRIQVLVVQVGQLLAEVARYEIVAENGAVVVRAVGEARSEVCGAVQVEIRFAQMAYERLTGVVSRYKMRMAQGKLLGLVRTCVVRFRREVLLDFGGGEGVGGQGRRFLDSMVVGGEESGKGGKWVVTGLEVPAGFPGLENGSVEFSHKDIEGCFEGVTGRVGVMVGEAMRRGVEDGVVSNIFLTGCFAKSTMLVKAVDSAIQHRGASRLWVQHECTPHGAVMQAKQLDFVNLQTS